MRLILPLLILLATPLQAQTEYDRVLIPLSIGETRGGFGSLWISELWVHNTDSVTRDFDARESCIATCPPRALAAGFARPVLRRFPAEAPGVIAHVERPSRSMHFNLRLQDISRQAETWGTELPVVRDQELGTEPLSLLNVPTDSRFRLMLRLYDIDGGPDSVVRVRAFSLVNGGTLGTADVPLTPPAETDRRYRPGYAQVSELLDMFPAVRAERYFGLEITPVTPGLRPWAFVSVTNNATQHFTTITPQ